MEQAKTFIASECTLRCIEIWGKRNDALEGLRHEGEIATGCRVDRKFDIGEPFQPLLVIRVLGEILGE